MPAARRPALYRVRYSPIHGRGVFAARAIRAGTAIIEYRGARMSYAQANRRPDSDPANPYHTFLFELHDGNVIDAGVNGNAARYINHACDPNCEPVEYERGRVFICAKRAIRAGEELTYDYGLQAHARLSRRAREAYACHCGARNCRGSMLDAVQ